MGNWKLKGLNLQPSKLNTFDLLESCYPICMRKLFLDGYLLRLLGDFLPNINKLLVGLQLLDLEQCPDVQLAVLEVRKL